MRSVVPVLLTLTLLSGCADRADDPPTTGGPSLAPPDHKPLRQVLDKQGNNDQCTQVLAGEQKFDFTVEEGYDLIQVSFHASGLGQVGYEVRGPDGIVLSAPETNPANQPCTHAHEGGAREAAAKPGAYSITVRNNGILGWHLVINEKQSGANSTTMHETH